MPVPRQSGNGNYAISVQAFRPDGTVVLISAYGASNIVPAPLTEAQLVALTMAPELTLCP